MVQKFCENVEISNKLNFREKNFRDFKATCSSTPPTYSARTNSVKREMPRVEIQSFIKEFHVYKARQLLYFLQEYTFLRSSFVPFRQH